MAAVWGREQGQVGSESQGGCRKKQIKNGGEKWKLGQE